MLLIGWLLTVSMVSSFETVVEWDFQGGAPSVSWQANGHLTDVTLRDGALYARATDWDPFFTCTGIEIDAKPSQCVRVSIKTDKPGNGQLFWTGKTSGKYGGFSQDKVTDFNLPAADDFQDIFVFPFWHGEDTIRQLRLDLYEGASFAIKSITVLERRGDILSQPHPSWDFSNSSERNGWLPLNNGKIMTAPALSIPLDEVGWITVAARSSADTSIALEWTTDAMLGSRRETVYVKQSDTPRNYHIEMQGHRDWEGRLVGLNLHIPEPQHVELERVSVAPEPDGPPEIEVVYFGFENGVNRANRVETLLAQYINKGGGTGDAGGCALELPEGLRLEGAPERNGGPFLKNGDIMEVRWRVKADTAGDFRVTLRRDTKPTADTVLTFLPAFERAASYVPEPAPVATVVDVCAYYFPGWDADAKYDCLRYTAPIRKPLLGYYDESNPECVDWQIKWAVENGIRCFLVDWYWVEGRQSLRHWFEAYREAKHRDYLKVAIMWANHNPPGTHSREDWRSVTREWIEHYFSLPGYYCINGKPAVFLWDAQIIRNDLGGSAAVAEAFAESQAMAKAAGYDGVEFIILQNHANAAQIAQWLEEGYAGNTSYHEFGRALEIAPSPSQARYADVVATAPEAWEQRRERSGELTYYPVVDTGWDSRPWHGSNAMAFHGRTVERFKELLEAARDYCSRNNQRVLILGPINEWGEGSYIEPNLEFGFDMYEAIREVFGVGNPATWPQNLSPRDVNLGPYDFPMSPQKLTWDFQNGAEGWAAMMNISNLSVADGVMRFETSSRDPALIVSTPGLAASEYPKMRIRMKVVGPLTKDSQGQLFWAIGSGGASEAASYRFTLHHDNDWHDYALTLSNHPRWRGRISMIRFDPCEIPGAEVFIEHVAFARE